MSPKCSFASKKNDNAESESITYVSVNDSTELALNDSTSNDSVPAVEDSVDEPHLTEDLNEELENEVHVCVTSDDGNEQCDCVAYRLKPHRKNKCSWKKHVVVGIASAAVISGVVLASSC